MTQSGIKYPISTLQLGMGWFPEQPGGLNRYYRDLITQIRRTGVEVVGVVAGSPDIYRDSEGIVTPFSPSDRVLPLRLLAARIRVSKVIQERSPNLIASHFALYTFPILDKLRDLPLVVHFQGPWSQEGTIGSSHSLKTGMQFQIENQVYRQATMFITLSRAFATILEQYYRVPAERIRTVPGGVDAGRYDINVNQSTAREFLGWPTDRPILLAVRRLVRRMGLENLILAMDEIAKTHPEALLRIAGRGPMARDLQTLIDERGLQNNVQLLGFLPDELLPMAYRAADLTVVPSVALEGFGLITLESLASGTPVLVTPVGGLPEAVGGLFENLILPGISVPEIAERIRDMLSGRVKLPGSEVCRTFAAEHYDWSVIAQKVRSVYEEALR